MLARSFSTTLPVLLLLSICQLAVAQQAGFSNQQDHPLLERFAGSEIVEYSKEQDVNYRLVLGNMRRTTGNVVAERSERVRGDLTRITYEIPQSFSGAEVIAFYQAQAADRGYDELFGCSGRGCGSSNYWANEVFGDRSLYGPERSQYYLALQASSNGAPRAYVAVYVITRANSRQFAHVEVLETSAMADESEQSDSVSSLLQNGALRISGIRFDVRDRLVAAGELDQLAELLQQNESIRFYVVAHLNAQGSGATFEALMARSLQRAEQVREQLIDRGIGAARLTAQGVGPLSPLCSEDDCAERVELVFRAVD